VHDAEEAFRESVAEAPPDRYQTLVVRRRAAPSRTMWPGRCRSSFETPATQALQDEV
jgi:hypothetical protein